MIRLRSRQQQMMGWRDIVSLFLFFAPRLAEKWLVGGSVDVCRERRQIKDVVCLVLTGLVWFSMLYLQRSALLTTDYFLREYGECHNHDCNARRECQRLLFVQCVGRLHHTHRSLRPRWKGGEGGFRCSELKSNLSS